MSHPLINRSPDLRRLRDEGYEIEISSTGFLLIHAIPYVNSRREIAQATLASNLSLAGERTTRPDPHTVFFSGDEPCQQDGTVIAGIAHSASTQSLAEGLHARHMFSNKPAGGYPDYYAKMTRYIEIISHPAISLARTQPGAAEVTPRTFKVVASESDASVFTYLDTASSRVGITEVNDKVNSQKIGIVGLGGSGAYVLDFVAKTPVAEIRLFDGDAFLQHNAFRCPGAASLQELERRSKKVDYLRAVYSNLHRKIVAHAVPIDESNLELLAGLSFVFVCVDSGCARRLILTHLLERGIPFIDVGMGVHLVEEEKSLVGILRVTAGTAQKHEHVRNVVPMGDADAPNDYAQNIQIAELNALNAALAVMKWKKLAGIYQDQMHEHHSTYTLNVHQLLREHCLDEC